MGDFECQRSAEGNKVVPDGESCRQEQRSRERFSIHRARMHPMSICSVHPWRADASYLFDFSLFSADAPDPWVLLLLAHAVGLACKTADTTPNSASPLLHGCSLPAITKYNMRSAYVE